MSQECEICMTHDATKFCPTEYGERHACSECAEHYGLSDDEEDTPRTREFVPAPLPRRNAKAAQSSQKLFSFMDC